MTSTLYHATLVHDVIRVRCPAGSRTQARMASVPDAYFDPATMCWYVPLSSAACLFAAVPLLVCSQELRAKLMEEVRG